MSRNPSQTAPGKSTLPDAVSFAASLFCWRFSCSLCLCHYCFPRAYVSVGSFCVGCWPESDTPSAQQPSKRGPRAAAQARKRATSAWVLLRSTYRERGLYFVHSENMMRLQCLMPCTSMWPCTAREYILIAFFCMQKRA